MNRKALIFTLLLTSTIMIVEFIGGLWTKSLALLADSGHMLSDATSLLLSFIAITIAARPPSPNKTFGYYRFEMMAALFNGVTLFVIAGWIIYEAIGRFADPPTVASGSMILIATIGLLANLGSATILLRQGDVEGNLNMKSAYVHVLGDLLGSIGAILAGVVMYVFNWYLADPIISIVVALLILKSAWGVFSQSVHVLMEGTPQTIDAEDVLDTLGSIDGVTKVHDLHIWTITSGLDMLTCHIVVREDVDEQVVLQEAIDRIRETYKIEHTTIQVEKPDLRHTEFLI
ncbi:cation diffusion facilitator family transporter [Planococcaceae bacterium Storch 2/2-2]|nr:cation diffusion facilitator family transporter [Planococcaceae bacterium Storch 2/2-2]